MLETTRQRPTVDTFAKMMALAATRLAGAGVAEPMADARRLAAAASGRSMAQLLGSVQEMPTAEQRREFWSLVGRRAAREPVSRILGHRYFWTLNLTVTPDVLDPRPETETLVETALEMAQRIKDRGRLRIIDVGTGTGAVLLAILAELPGATGVGTDISPAALEVAAENARRHGLQDRARFAVADGLDGVAGPFDLLVSNPPYIQTSAISALEPEVSRFDPRLALDGGFDGLDAYRRIASGLQSVVPNGWTMFEIGKDQKDAVVSILGVAISPGKAGIIESRMDLSGTTRVVAAKTQD